MILKNINTQHEYNKRDNGVLKQSLNNPYQYIDPSKQLSPLQILLDRIGITNFRGKAQNQLDLLSNQWQSEYNLALEDREYNSQKNQAELMRNAGLNPDILGVPNYESQTSGNSASDDQLTDIQDEGLNLLVSVGNSVKNGIEMAIGFSSGIMQNQSLKIKNIIDSYQASENIFKSVKDAYVPFISIYNGATDINKDWFYELTKPIKNRKLRKSVNNRINDWIKSPEFNKLAYKNDKEFEKERQEYLNQLSVPNYNVDDKEFIKALSATNDFFLKVQKVQGIADISKAKFDEEYYNKAFTYGLAHNRVYSEMQSNAYNLAGKELDNKIKIQNKELQQFTLDLYKDLKNSGFVGQLILFNILSNISPLKAMGQLGSFATSLIK